MKKIISLLLTCLLFISMSLSIQAQTTEEHQSKRYIIKGDVIVDTDTDKKYGSPHKFDEDGKKVKASLEEFRDVLNEKDKTDKAKEKEEKEKKEKKDEEINSINEFGLVSPMINIQKSYEETSSTTYWGDSFHISAWLSCPSGGTDCTIESSVGWSVSEEFGVNVESGWKDYIKAGVSFSWNTTVTRGTVYTIPLEPGKAGRIRFMPLSNVTYGNYLETMDGIVIYDESIRAQSPASVPMTGEPDGWYYVEYY
ncbi:hypothetical protein BKP35_16360 [Anaerobacillus arseniciselenatis]|uniref:Uncharacterized protein n=1 Tax=Anaerobacillus arseniciselenatis TaxID=85682 RepID=A0A1S2LAQ1_9BACI|nr:hypothetical protein [Anaerobacillus arseniciselenatis]OIJ09426.1 hypothetical protein BKP35_16360 [Anaerobacillus arseniciselenatis]